MEHGGKVGIRSSKGLIGAGGRGDQNAETGGQPLGGIPAGKEDANVLLNKRQPGRHRGLSTAPSGVGRLGKTANGTGLVVVDIKYCIKFSDLQKVMNLFGNIRKA